MQAIELLALIALRERTLAETLQAAGKAVRLAGQPHGFIIGQAAVWRVQQSVLLRAVDRHVIVVAHAGIDELDLDLLPDALKVAIPPSLERESRSRSASLFRRALIGAATRMRIG